MSIKYDSLVKSLADTFVTSTERIEGYIHGLSEQGLLAVGRDENDTRIVRLREKNLLHQVMKKKD